MRGRDLAARLGSADELGPLSGVQLAERIAAGVRDGRLPAGVELPSERDLAAAIARSRGTVARAYEQLRHQGLAYTRHGAGTTIGCCPGPWASSRAAELAALTVPVDTADDGVEPARVIDLRHPSWPAPPAALVVDASGDRTRDGASRDPVTDVAAGIAAHLTEHGLVTEPDQLILTSGGLRALDVALGAVLRPRDRALVSALATPEVLALLAVRGVRPVAVPVDDRGYPDVPAWTRVLRTSGIRVALLAAYGQPAGTALRDHELRLLLEAAADAHVTVIDDRTQADLWIAGPSPSPPEAIDVDSRVPVVTIASLAALTWSDLGMGWIRVADPVLRTQVRAVARALQAQPGSLATSAAPSVLADHPERLPQRRERLARNLAAVIRAVTPLGPHVALTPPKGGGSVWMSVPAPGSEVAAAARDHGVLVRPGADHAVDGRDLHAVGLALTADPQVFATGLARLLHAVAPR